MARNYPRFLLSTSYNVKSPGIFINHTLEPRIFCKVHLGLPPNATRDSDNHFEYFDDFALELLRPMPEDENGNRYGDKIRTTLMAMARWYYSQLEEEGLLNRLIRLTPKLSPELNQLRPYIKTISREFVDFDFQTIAEFNKFQRILIEVFPNRHITTIDTGTTIFRGEFGNF